MILHHFSVQLLFQTKPNYDSLKPSTIFLKSDITQVYIIQWNVWNALKYQRTHICRLHVKSEQAIKCINVLVANGQPSDNSRFLPHTFNRTLVALSSAFLSRYNAHINEWNGIYQTYNGTRLRRERWRRGLNGAQFITTPHYIRSQNTIISFCNIYF